MTNQTPRANGAEPPGSQAREIDLNQNTVTALNAALVAAFTGVHPVLTAAGKWLWVFPGDEEAGEPEQRYEGEPPPWVQADHRALHASLNALCAKEGFTYTIVTRALPSADGLVELRAQVQIGFLDPTSRQLKARSRAEAAPPELAIGFALAGYLSLDVEGWERRLFPKLATAANDGGMRPN